MKFIYVLFTACTMLPAIVNAQSFVNGSFESSNANPGSCNYLNNDGLSTYTNGADTGYGPANNIAYIGAPATNCVHGLAHEGSAYIALSSNKTDFDAIAMRVSPALQAGKSYTISFVYKASLSGPAITTRLGYSTNNNSDGTLIDSIPSPSTQDTIWKPMTYTFSPATAAEWITLKAEISAFNGYSFIEFDDFKLMYAQDVTDVLAVKGYSVSPNPAAGYININTLYNKPINVVITDMTGRAILKTESTPKNGNVTIRTDEIPGGLYLINMNNGEHSATEKIFVVH